MAKKRLVGFSLDPRHIAYLEKLHKETGASQAELVRRMIDKEMDKDVVSEDARTYNKQKVVSHGQQS